MSAQRSNRRGWAETEVVFGSHVRGDHDSRSDRDILIVDDDRAVLRNRILALEAKGWSVAPYTFRKLESLAAQGALFLQHLKNESRVIHDRQGRFRTILSAFRPKGCYASEISQNTQLANLISSQPATAGGALWAADVLYVTVRNFGVLKLAGEQTYLFGYALIIDELVNRRIVDGAGKSALLRLRFLKSLYRSGAKLGRKKVVGTIGRALDALPHHYFPANSLAVDPLTILRTSRPPPKDATAYNRLRNLEKAYLALCGLNPDAKSDPLMQRLERWIRNPRVYANVATIVEQATLHALRTHVQAMTSTVSYGIGFGHPVYRVRD